MSSQVSALVDVALFLATAGVFDLYCLRELKEQPMVAVFARETWFYLIILATPLGGMTFLTIGRPR